MLEAIILALVVSTDAFVASFAYGNKRIKIPFISAQILTIICSFVLGISLFIGEFVRLYIPDWLTILLCFSILFILGIVKLLDSITKSLIKKYNIVNKKIKFHFLNFKFILNLYANPLDADIDSSRTISPKEAFILAMALSLDGLAIGFGAALGNANVLITIIASYIIGIIAVIIGCVLGNKITNRYSYNLSWLSGIILIILAISKLF